MLHVMLASHSMLGITASVLMLQVKSLHINVTRYILLSLNFSSAEEVDLFNFVQMVCIIRLRWRPCLCPHLVSVSSSPFYLIDSMLGLAYF